VKVSNAVSDSPVFTKKCMCVFISNSHGEDRRSAEEPPPRSLVLSKTSQ